MTVYGRDLERISLSRMEERRGWLGRAQREPEPPDRAWFQRDDPLAAELAAIEPEREAAA